MAVENPDDINGVIDQAKTNAEKRKAGGSEEKDKPDVEVRITLY